MMKRVLQMASGSACADPPHWLTRKRSRSAWVAPFTGIGAELRPSRSTAAVEQVPQGSNADKFKPYKIKIISATTRTRRAPIQDRRAGAPDPRRTSDALAGWNLFAERDRLARRSVSAGKKIGVIMNAGTAHITTMSPYFVSTSFSMWHAGLCASAKPRPSSSSQTAVVATPTSRPAAIRSGSSR